MPPAVKREKLSEGVYFTSITDKKFTTNTIKVRLLLPLKRETAALNAIVPDLLMQANANYPTIAEFSDKLKALYGAGTMSNAGKIGDLQVLTLSASCIDDAYTIDKEKINGELIDLLCDCIFRPVREGDGFDSLLFSITKQSLLDEIIGKINDKRGYALSRAYTSIYEGEPAAVQPLGELSEAESITSEGAYCRYLEILKTALVDIHFVGCGDPSYCRERLGGAFSAAERDFCELATAALSPLKSEVREVSEHYDITQAKMVMGFKYDSEDRPAVKLMNMIFGMTPFSKLFTNVREKLSLCYYCQSVTNAFKQTLIVDSGIKSENFERSRQEILNQLSAMQSGDFTDGDIVNAKLYLADSYASYEDGASSFSAWIFAQSMGGETFSPEEANELIQAVDRERIIAAAKSVRPDTVYLMTGEGE